MKDVRLLPILMVACSAMLALKLLGFMNLPGSVWQEFAGTANVFAQEVDAGAEEADASEDMTMVPGMEASIVEGQPARNTELSILESLRNRRKVLMQREEELQLRENLIEAAEGRLESRIGQLEALEQRLQAATEAELGARKEELRGLVTMYETMKPKEAARIFDRLQMDVLIDVVLAMNPRKMASVLASMNPEAAQRLTIEMAKAGRRDTPSGIDQLPKIGG
ncbi:MAG: MotE family protein [Alphaproteobacteria bacterium]